jgi:hypothetical protein
MIESKFEKLIFKKTTIKKKTFNNHYQKLLINA